MSVCTTAIFDAPISQVWAIISDFANIKRWHPLIIECKMIGRDQGEGAVRRVHFADWWAEEELTEIDDQKCRLTYLVTGSSRPIAIGASGSMALNAIGDNQTKLEWYTRQAEGNPQEAELDAQLRTYYPQRMNHLRAALGLPAEQGVAE